MSGWFRTESDGHERTMVALQAAGVEIPRDLALMDLRYYQNLVLTGQRRGMPSRSDLMARWHWTDKRVRNLLADEPAWVDPSKADAWAATKGPARVQPRSSEGPAKVQSDHDETVTTDENGPAEVQRGSSRGPARVHTRVVGTEQEQEQEQKDGDERRRAGEGKTKGAPKAKAQRKTPDEAWSRLLGDRWVIAWNPDRHGTYVWDWWKDRQHLARAAAAVGVELNQPPPPEALDHLERAMGAYIGAARRGDPTCFPKGLPTVGGFVQKLSEWLMSTERTVVSADVPKATVEARVRRELDAGATLAEVRARLKVTTKLKPPEVAYALSFLDRLESPR